MGSPVNQGTEEGRLDRVQETKDEQTRLGRFRAKSEVQTVRFGYFLKVRHNPEVSGRLEPKRVGQDKQSQVCLQSKVRYG